MTGPNIEDLFLEMKRTSELMVDLAYSSLLYDNKEIAREVLILEDRVDTLNTTIQRMAVDRSIEDKNANKALIMISLCSSIEQIADGAMEIADVVLRDIEPHPIIRMSLRDSDEIITHVRVSPGSFVADRTLESLQLPCEIGMWIIAVKRGAEWTYDPDRDFRLQEGDLIIASGSIEGEDDLRRMAN